MIFIGILVSIVMFSLIVLFHELGHFKSARFFGVKVEEFGLGIPPKAKKIFTDKLGTIYTLNWLPLGGFVKLKGEQFHNFLIYNKKGKILKNEEILKKIEDKEDIFDTSGEKISGKEQKEIVKKLKENLDSDNLINKPYWQQSIIILGGVIMNFFLAFIIFSILFMIGVKPVGINDKIKTDLNVKLIPNYETAIKEGILIKKEGIILSPIEESIAKKAGILENDILLKINETEIFSKEEAIALFLENKSTEITLSIKRNTENISLSLIPSSEGKIGSYVGDNIEVNKNFKYKYSFFSALKVGASETYAQTMLTFSGLKMLVSHIFFPEYKEQREEAIDNMAGPIGIVSLITDALAGGVMLIIIIGAVISINLGVFNLLPIPALDGGRFMFICINAITEKLTGKKRISPYFEGIIHVLFFVLLIALSIIIAYNDVSKIISK